MGGVVALSALASACGGGDNQGVGGAGGAATDAAAETSPDAGGGSGGAGTDSGLGGSAGTDSGLGGSAGADSGLGGSAGVDAGLGGSAGADAGLGGSAGADAGLGGSDAGTPDTGTDAAPEAGTDAGAQAKVRPLYPTNGADWSEWVKNDGSDWLTATDTACDPATGATVPDGCMHAGELRQYDLAGFSDCTGVTISDELGAFNWICDDSGATPRAVSTGLKDGKNLSDLLDLGAATPVWKDERVVATQGSTTVMSNFAQWWSNPIVVDNNGGTLGTDGTVYVVSTDTTAHYTLPGNGASLVVAPGATLTGDSGCNQVLKVSGDCTWVEGTFLATACYGGIEGNSSHYLVIHHADVEDAQGTGINLVSADAFHGTDVVVAHNQNEGLVSTGKHGRYRNIVATTNDDDGSPDPTVAGIWFQREGNHLADSTITGNSLDVHYGTGGTTNIDVQVRNVTVDGGRVNLLGVRHSFFRNLEVKNFAGAYTAVELAGDSFFNVFYDLTVLDSGASSGNPAIDGQKNNVFVGLAEHNAPGDGIHLQKGSAILGGVVAGNNDQDGVVVSARNTLMAVLSIDNTDPVSAAEANGFQLVGVDNVLRNLAATHNAGADLYNASTANGTALTGTSFVENTGGDCFVGTNATGVDFDNACNAAGSATISGGFSAGGVMASPTFDLSSSSTILGVAPVPGGNDVVTHTLTDTITSATCATATIDGAVWDPANSLCRVTFLRDAYEVPDDGIGNDNGFCQSGETCVYMPNIGRYQGHGSLVSQGSIGTGGTIQNVTLLRYQTNGR